jgi:hypothetical protein
LTEDGEYTQLVLATLKDPLLYAQYGAGTRLRAYQAPVMQAVITSVVKGLGLSFVVIFPRQSGKNELQAHIECYLLHCFSRTGGDIVKVSPTWKPQSLNAMRRLEKVLGKNYLIEGLWTKESGYIYRCEQARLTFLSGEPQANIVGATASLLLEVDEAQDIQIDKFDKDIAPMAASANATRVFWGTAWTSRTLLARELRSCRQAEASDGQRRVFRINADDVARELPAYGRHVAEMVARLGRNHPSVRTQYFSEEIDADGGLFHPARTAAMRGSHSIAFGPLSGYSYAFLLDVAGEDESGGSSLAQNLANPGRDATALTVVEVDLSGLEDALLRAPRYRTVLRQQWLGVKHSALYGQLKALVETWRPIRVVVDATGVGAGLASFLSRAFPGRVRPFLFNSASKSRLGWNFVTLCDHGRYLEPITAADEGQTGLQAEFWRQASFCQFETLHGPDHPLRWGVPDGTRDPADGQLVHDDLLISAALSAALDEEGWVAPSAPALLVPAPDPLKDLDRGF